MPPWNRCKCGLKRTFELVEYLRKMFKLKGWIQMIICTNSVEWFYVYVCQIDGVGDYEFKMSNRSRCGTIRCSQGVISQKWREVWQNELIGFIIRWSKNNEILDKHFILTHKHVTNFTFTVHHWFLISKFWRQQQISYSFGQLTDQYPL